MGHKGNTPKIIQLMGKEDKKQSREAHGAITGAFKKRQNGGDPDKDREERKSG